jgi:hypothetical protein
LQSVTSHELGRHLAHLAVSEDMARVIGLALEAQQVARCEAEVRQTDDLMLGVPHDAAGRFEPSDAAQRHYLRAAERHGPEQMETAREALRQAWLEERVGLLEKASCVIAPRPLRARRLHKRQRRGSCRRPGARRRARAPSRDGPSDESEGDGEGPTSPARTDLTPDLGFYVSRNTGFGLPVTVAALLAPREREAAR